jgi:hypothetical protein
MEDVIGDTRHPAAGVEHHFQGMQQDLTRALDREAAIFLNPAVLHFEETVPFDDDVGVLEVAVHKDLAVEHHPLTVERFTPYRLHLRVTSLFERARISARMRADCPDALPPLTQRSSAPVDYPELSTMQLVERRGPEI